MKKTIRVQIDDGPFLIIVALAARKMLSPGAWVKMKLAEIIEEHLRAGQEENARVALAAARADRTERLKKKESAISERAKRKESAEKSMEALRARIAWAEGPTTE